VETSDDLLVDPEIPFLGRAFQPKMMPSPQFTLRDLLVATGVLCCGWVAVPYLAGALHLNVIECLILTVLAIIWAALAWDTAG
jgi:hypothetical protein